MLPRSWIAILLLINYLFVVGMGCMSRPEDQHEFVLVQTTLDGQYQECRYLRMDGLENFLAESLASKYQNASEAPKHHLLTVVSGIDAHCVPSMNWPVHRSVCRVVKVEVVPCQFPVLSGWCRIVYPPPRVG